LKNEGFNNIKTMTKNEIGKIYIRLHMQKHTHDLRCL
jgi:hypothetical protein